VEKYPNETKKNRSKVLGLKRRIILKMVINVMAGRKLSHQVNVSRSWQKNKHTGGSLTHKNYFEKLKNFNFLKKDFRY